MTTHPADVLPSHVDHWHEKAACRDEDPRLWFPTNIIEEGVAVYICEHCPVMTECQQTGLDQHDDPGGIWGGLTFTDRNEIRRQPNG